MVGQLQLNHAGFNKQEADSALPRHESEPTPLEYPDSFWLPFLYNYFCLLSLAVPGA